MTTLMTINTIELANVCNLACSYCINRKMAKTPVRSPGIMTDEIFDLACYWLEELIEQGTQQEVNLNGNGESTLDPQLAARAARVVQIVEGRQVSFCTNGLTMTDKLAKDLKHAGIKRVDLSLHNAAAARRAADILLANGIAGTLAAGAVAAPHNWADQIEPEYRVKVRIQLQCDPLIEGRGYIQREGFVTPCCYDYRNLGVYGHVQDKNLLTRPMKRFELCDTCHQVIPAGVPT